MPRKICVVTGTRAEYGLLRPVMTKLKSDQDLIFQLVVTGTHLSAQHGMTVREIEADGFVPNELVAIDLEDDSKLGVASALANATAKFSESFSRIAPDVVVVLGDRYEILACVQSALIMGIPVAHIHGGEVTTGAFDDSIRHAITKMSNIHFVAAQEYARRVIQLGEQPHTVFNVGSLGVELAQSMPLLSSDELSNSLNLDLTKKVLLVTFHPTTRSDNSSSDETKELLAALDNFGYCTIIFTGTNADPGNSEITSQIEKFVSSDTKNRASFKSLGQTKYFSLMKICSAVVGNSSSGIIEAPSFKVPTVNIGTRQDGRLRAESIIESRTERGEIKVAIETALSSTWRERCSKTKSVYGSDNTAQLITGTLKTVELTTQKKFFDLV